MFRFLIRRRRHPRLDQSDFCIRDRSRARYAFDARRQSDFPPKLFCALSFLLSFFLSTKLAFLVPFLLFNVPMRRNYSCDLCADATTPVLLRHDDGLRHPRPFFPNTPAPFFLCLSFSSSSVRSYPQPSCPCLYSLTLSALGHVRACPLMSNTHTPFSYKSNAVFVGPVRESPRAILVGPATTQVGHASAFPSRLYARLYTNSTRRNSRDFSIRLDFLARRHVFGYL